MSDSDEERALPTIKKDHVNDESLLDCPCCEDIAISQDGLDNHINTEHVSKKPLTYLEWKTHQKVKKNSLHALFESDPEILQHA